MEKKKIILIILLTGILSALLIIFGFFSPYNFFSAKQAIKANIYRKVCINEHPVYYRIEKSVGEKYGFEVVNIETKKGIRPINYFGIKTYNNLMKENYIKIKGAALYQKYQNELDSICSMNIVK